MCGEIARKNNHSLGDWKEDSGEHYGYGQYALCARKGCTVYAWVSDRATNNRIRGSIFDVRVCPVRKGMGE